MINEYNLALNDQQFKESILWLFTQINANTIALHDHLLKIHATDKEDYAKLSSEALKMREHILNQIQQNLYEKYGNVDFGGLMK